MKKIVCIVIGFIHFNITYAQTNHCFELSMGSVREQNYNLFTSNLFMAGVIPAIDNRYAGFLALGYEYKNKSHFSPVIAAKLVARRIDYVYLDATVAGFIHQTLEIPLSLRYTSAINTQYNWHMDVGPGINSVLTSNKRSQIVVDEFTKTRFQFINERSLQFFAHGRFGFETKLKDKQSLVLFLGYQYQLTPLFHFKANTNSFDFKSGNVNTNYLSLGLTYRFSFKPKVSQ